MTQPISHQVEIVNIRGLHARAASKFCTLAQQFTATVQVSKDGMTVGGCSLMALLMLGADKGSVITIDAVGEDADKAVADLCALVQDKFGEEA